MSTSNDGPNEFNIGYLCGNSAQKNIIISRLMKAIGDKTKAIATMTAGSPEIQYAIGERDALLAFARCLINE